MLSAGAQASCFLFLDLKQEQQLSVDRLPFSVSRVLLLVGFILRLSFLLTTVAEKLRQLLKKKKKKKMVRVGAALIETKTS